MTLSEAIGFGVTAAIMLGVVGFLLDEWLKAMDWTEKP